MDIFQQAKRMNEEFTKFQEELTRLEYEGAAGAGMVKVKVNGRQEILSIQIDPSILKVEEQQMVQDLVAAAVNQALATAKEKTAEEMRNRMGQFAGGLGALSSLFGGKG